MNIDSLRFQLGEMQIHLQSCLADLESGELAADDDAALAVKLGHLLDHICLAWNTRDVAPSDFAKISDAEFSGHSNTVPNFGSTRRLSDAAFRTDA